MRAISDVVRALAGQERSVSNARAAATQLSRQRVERQDVELYLADRYAGLRAGQPAASEGDGTRTARRR
ncbi:MAG: hypothetical protein QOK15_640 [Nocardioidaceae bacterium]|nr:hypothetical protein [Nocardioidaceae bacterium]